MIALHNKMLLGQSSRFSITVDPVVVIPDILSKKASLNDKFNDDKTNGILPKTAIETQVKVENRKVC
tara:strand:- start:26 stop:226 length:201 start_codon:yes stop_codon:yes gene_type:complete